MDLTSFAARHGDAERALRMFPSRRRSDASSELGFATGDAEVLRLQERRRIAMDLHDDLGAKLLTLVHAGDAARMIELAGQALDDMRLIVEGLSGPAKPVGEAIAGWRSEFVSRLGDAGIDPAWEHAVDDESALLVSRTYMQATRILREAISNVIRHSRATRCSVRCRVTLDVLELDVCDNGAGMRPGRADGHGLAGMRDRAAQANGICVVEPATPTGVAVRLSIPLRAAAG